MVTANQVLVLMLLRQNVPLDARGIACSFQDAGQFVSTDDVQSQLDYLVDYCYVVKALHSDLGYRPYFLTSDGESRASALLALTLDI